VRQSFVSRVTPHLACIVLVCLLIAAVYSNALQGSFVFDDIRNIERNGAIQLTEFDLRRLYVAGMDSPTANRPVTNISFALNYLFGKHDVRGYHLVNVLVHMVNGLLVYALAFVTLKLLRRTANVRAVPPSDRFAILVAAVTALVFTAHPIQTQSVTYVVQRMNSLATLFYLGALLLFIAGRRSQITWRRAGLWTGCLGCWLLGLGSKQTAATLPLAVLLYELAFFQDVRRPRIGRQLSYICGISALLVILCAVFLGFEPVARILGGYDIRDFTMGERILTQFRVVNLYFGLLLFPHPARLNIAHDVVASQSPTAPATTILAMLLLISLVASAVLLAKHHRLISFCIAWIFLHLLVESSVIGLELIFEHRLYLPMFGFCLGAAWLLGAAMAGKPARIVVAGSAAVLLLSVWTHARNVVWQDRASLWMDVAQKSPNSSRAQTNLGNVLADEGRVDSAIERYLTALDIDENDHLAHNNVGRILLDTNRIGEAITHFQRALKIRPNHAPAHNNLGVAFRSKGRIDESLARFRRAVELDPRFVPARCNLADAYRARGDIERAIRHYEAALGIAPDTAAAHHGLGTALAGIERRAGAIHHLRRALESDAAIAATHVNLGIELAADGDVEEAIRHFRRAIELEPDNAAGPYNAAVAFQSTRRLLEAVEMLHLVLKIDPRHTQAHFGLATVLSSLGRVEEALPHLYETLRLDPQSVAALQFAAWTLATHPVDSVRDPRRAFELAGRAVALTGENDAVSLNVLAASTAALGRFDEAIKIGEKARQQAERSGNATLARRIGDRIDRYRQGSISPDRQE